MDREFRDVPGFVAWGPFIPSTYKNEDITLADVVIASVVWGLTVVFSILAVYLGYGQTIGSRYPWKSIYVWLIWLELIVCFVMGLECFLHLMKIIRPSFAFYFTILFWWCIQVQLLLQIIINRIRVIIPDRKLSRHIMIATAVFVTLINISVFNIWIPARLQISHRYIHINEIWDRIEKVLYLITDAMLNGYFLKTVKANLINNGLQKYNKLLRFNQRIIVVSLLMDVMIILAMSIPNSFVYIQFHPLAYLVKLNIEMTMANLIKRIAVSKARRPGHASVAHEYNSEDISSASVTCSRAPRNPYIELTTKAARKNWLGQSQSSPPPRADDERVISFVPTGSQIKKTREILITSDPNPEYNGNRKELVGKNETVVIHTDIESAKSLDDSTDSGDSLDERLEQMQNSAEERKGDILERRKGYSLDRRRDEILDRRRADESDDEVSLVPPPPPPTLPRSNQDRSEQHR
ncbi:unnamed protein product [Periconia digitata]|uniref:Uncharacterized protein n=1 Tax=Periconia digitata TaxID=1303443 RepID=A0A9W4UF76_9PLEO|nr:unnamed protein product [Periconia digitata]